MHLENKDFFAQNQRIEYIDIAKGMGIILMIMGHIGYGELFHRFIHAFHMPLFYFCAGLLYKEKSKAATCALYLFCLDPFCYLLGNEFRSRFIAI